MPRFRPKGMLAKSAAEDLFRHTLSRIPTVYGKLVFFGSLRDSNTDSYRHHGLSVAFGREDATNALREGHQAVFRQWLTTALSEKYDDLTQYIASLDAPRSETARKWLRSKAYRSCVPFSASAAESAYFISDLETLLTTLSYEAAAAQ
jgi:hypothetical protein